MNEFIQGFTEVITKVIESILSGFSNVLDVDMYVVGKSIALFLLVFVVVVILNFIINLLDRR